MRIEQMTLYRRVRMVVSPTPCMIRVLLFFGSWVIYLYTVDSWRMGYIWGI